jgi:hypothetical protein
MTTQEILYKASRHVQSRWARGKLLSNNGGVCAMGAINKAVHGDAYHVFGATPNKPTEEMIAMYHLSKTITSFATPTKIPNTKEGWQLIVNIIMEWNNSIHQRGKNVATTLEYAGLLLTVEFELNGVSNGIQSSNSLQNTK